MGNHRYLLILQGLLLCLRPLFYCTGGVLIVLSRFSLPSSTGFIVPTEYDIHMAGDSRLRRLIGNVYRIGLGGEGVLRTEGREQETQKMLEAAYEGGIRYFDSDLLTRTVNDITAVSGISTRTGKLSPSRPANRHREMRKAHRQT